MWLGGVLGFFVSDLVALGFGGVLWLFVGDLVALWLLCRRVFSPLVWDAIVWLGGVFLEELNVLLVVGVLCSATT